MCFFYSDSGSPLESFGNSMNPSWLRLPTTTKEQTTNFSSTFQAHRMWVFTFFIYIFGGIYPSKTFRVQYGGSAGYVWSSSTPFSLTWKELHILMPRKYPIYKFSFVQWPPYCWFQQISLIATQVTSSASYLEVFYTLLLDASHTAGCSLDSGQRWRYHSGTQQIPPLQCSRV